MKNLLLLFSPVIVLLFSCNKTSLPKYSKDLVSVSKTSINGSSDAFKDTIQIKTNKSWTIDKPDSIDWLSISPLSGSGNDDLYLSIKKNTTPRQRRVIISLKSGEYSEDVTLTQAGRIPFHISKTEIQKSADIFKDTITIATTTNWRLSGIPNWLIASKDHGHGADSIVLSAYKNYETETRSAKLLFKVADKVKTVKISQSGQAEKVGFTIPEGWQLIFDDEFHATGDFDNTQWSFAPRSSITVAWTKYLTEGPDYAHLDGKHLVLRLDDANIPGDDVPYHSGAVQTKGKFNFTYGKVEVRAKFNQGQGAWPAIWMMPEKPTYGGWPQSGEIDIMEHVNYANVVHSTAHNGAHTNSSGSSDASGSTAYQPNDYNVYGLEWTPEALKFYVNGALSYTYNKPSQTTSAEWPYDQPFYLILDQAGGAGWPGAIDNNDLPFHMKVDWVRVYKKKK